MNLKINLSLSTSIIFLGLFFIKIIKNLL